MIRIGLMLGPFPTSRASTPVIENFPRNLPLFYNVVRATRCLGFTRNMLVVYVANSIYIYIGARNIRSDIVAVLDRLNVGHEFNLGGDTSGDTSVGREYAYLGNH